MVAVAGASSLAVSLEDMLRAREQRAERQGAAIARYGVPVVSATVVMPGRFKDTPLTRAVMDAAEAEIATLLEQRGWPLLFCAPVREPTGPEALFAVRAEARSLKHGLVALEETHPLGRLWDLDVIAPASGPVTRRMLGLGPRRCLVCDAPAHECARARRHALPELMAAITSRIDGWRAGSNRARVAHFAHRALLREAFLTPKPGLVDRRNSGAHRDMDLRLFVASACAIRPWWAKFFDCGAAGGGLELLRRHGLDCEQAMLQATGGVNTHKGSIFAFGLLCGAAGRLSGRGQKLSREALCGEVADTCAGLVEEMRGCGPARSAGIRVFREHGVAGARGEAASGFATVRMWALPEYDRLRAAGHGETLALLGALVELLAFNVDTNLLARGGPAGLAFMQDAALGLRARGGVHAEDFISVMRRLDEAAMARNLSPSGSADLLAVTWFLARFPP
jgi:triphosphoribosyl-dephospho-CoA synthase CitG/holo-ACP synthase CitX